MWLLSDITKGIEEKMSNDRIDSNMEALGRQGKYRIVQSNPQSGSPDNGSIRLTVQDLASPSPILLQSLSKSLSDNVSIRLLVQFLAGSTAEPLSELHCNPLFSLTPQNIYRAIHLLCHNILFHCFGSTSSLKLYLLHCSSKKCFATQTSYL